MRPCVNGLDALATTMELLAVRPRLTRAVASPTSPPLCGLVEGRGACAHPDGAARFVRSALRVFADHAGLHLQRGPCHSTAAPVLPLPADPPAAEPMRRSASLSSSTPSACDGNGVCAELLPERIRLDPWGFPVIEPGECPTHLLDHAQRAVTSCPRLALTLVQRGHLTRS